MVREAHHRWCGWANGENYNSPLPREQGNCQTPSWRVCDYPHRHETLHYGVCGNPLSLPRSDVDAIEVPKDLDRLGYYAGIPASLPSCLGDADWNGESVVQQDIDRGLWGQNIVRMALAGDILHQPDIPSPQLPLGAVAGPGPHLAGQVDNQPAIGQRMSRAGSIPSSTTPVAPARPTPTPRFLRTPDTSTGSIKTRLPWLIANLATTFLAAATFVSKPNWS